jgi:hypothetical protein
MLHLMTKQSVDENWFPCFWKMYINIKVLGNLLFLLLSDIPKNNSVSWHAQKIVWDHIVQVLQIKDNLKSGNLLSKNIKTEYQNWVMSETNDHEIRQSSI